MENVRRLIVKSIETCFGMGYIGTKCITIIIIIIIIIIMAVKRKDASLNKILTRRNRVACHYHSLK